MMNKKLILIGILSLTLVFAGCSSSEEASGNAAETNDSQTSATQGSDQQEVVIRLEEDFEDALSIQAQLAIGTLQLEQTELALDEALAADLLPLWQALQSLNNSDTAAAAEINAVENQIQETMSVAQLSAIKEMALTGESVTAMIEDGTLALRGGGRFGGGQGEDGGFPARWRLTRWNTGRVRRPGESERG
jgi:hypothetical protein